MYTFHSSLETIHKMSACATYLPTNIYHSFDRNRSVSAELMAGLEISHCLAHISATGLHYQCHCRFVNLDVLFIYDIVTFVRIDRAKIDILSSVACTITCYFLHSMEHRFRRKGLETKFCAPTCKRFDDSCHVIANQAKPSYFRIVFNNSAKC